MQTKNQITLRKKPKDDCKYIIKIEGNIVWEGKNPKPRLTGLLKDRPGDDIRISWKSSREFFIA